MRLIDADALMEEIAKHSYIVRQKDNSRDLGMTVYGIQQCVDEQPTAYNLDKVITKIENFCNDQCYLYCTKCCALEGSHESILDIVKGGGTND